MAKKDQATAVVESDEIEALDEEAPAEEAAPKAKRAKKEKVEKPAPVGMSSKEAAAALGITPVKLRRILRTDDFYNDKGYTRYDLTDADLERVRAAIAAGSTEKKPRTKKSKKAEATEEAATVADDLDQLDDLETEDADEADLDLEDEDDDEE